MHKYFGLKWKLILTVSITILLLGCQAQWSTYGLFTKPELARYERFALFGLDAEKEQIFMSHFISAFPERNITFVERSRLRNVITEQDLLPGRLDDDKRARLRKILGVEAVILCDFHRHTRAWVKLQVRMLDTETAAIIGSVVVDVTDEWGFAPYVDFGDVVRRAVESLRADLMKTD